MGAAEVKTHRERPIPPGALRRLYDHAGRSRPADEPGIEAVLGCGPAVGAWDGDELVGFAKALSNGRLAAYVDDIVVRERHRGGGLGGEIVSRLLREVGEVGRVSLFCEPEVRGFYEGNGFRRTPFVVLVMRRLGEG